MSQKEHSRAHRRRTYKRVRGVILILLVLYHLGHYRVGAP